MDDYVAQVPQTYRQRYKEIVKLTDAFCDQFLNDNYKDLSRKLTAVFCQDGSPVERGKTLGWAGGILRSLARVNFLSDPSRSPNMSAQQMAEGLGVGASTMTAKSKVVWDFCDLMPMHPDWCEQSLMEENPLVWMAQVNGFMVDLRDAPCEVQVIAYEQGMIPYIAADQPHEDGDDNAQTEGFLNRIGFSDS